MKPDSRLYKKLFKIYCRINCASKLYKQSAVVQIKHILYITVNTVFSIPIHLSLSCRNCRPLEYSNWTAKISAYNSIAFSESALNVNLVNRICHSARKCSCFLDMWIQWRSQSSLNNRTHQSNSNPLPFAFFAFPDKKFLISISRLIPNCGICKTYSS